MLTQTTFDSEESPSEMEQSDEQISSQEDINMDSDEETDKDNDSHSMKVKENPSWADAMSKILKTNKPKRRKTIVLSRAKRANQVKVSKEEKLDFDIDRDVKLENSTVLPKPEEKEVKIKEESCPKKLKKKEWASKGCVKPSVLEKDREKALAKIATRGVVQLFNAVREHQKTLEKDLEDAGPLEHKKDKVIKSLDKRAFLDVLMGPAKSQPVSNLVPKEIKEDADNPTWSILRDDFMMSSKLKDWDKNDTSEMKDEL